MPLLGVFQANAAGDNKHFTPNGVERQVPNSKNYASKRNHFNTLAQTGPARSRIRQTGFSKFLLASERNGGIRQQTAALPARLFGGVRFGLANHVRKNCRLGWKRVGRNRSLG